MVLTGTFQKSYQRQIDEGIRINSHVKETLLNSKSEFRGPSIKRRIVEGRNEECNVCGERFGSKFMLMKHKEAVHEDLTFPCNKCKQVLKSKSNRLEQIGVSPVGGGIKNLKINKIMIEHTRTHSRTI